MRKSIVGLLLAANAACASHESTLVDYTSTFSEIARLCRGQPEGVSRIDMSKFPAVCLVGTITESRVAEVEGNWLDGTSTLVVNSGGGDAFASMELVNLLRLRKFDLIIAGECISSCANQLLPAARTKFLAKDAIIGWHGGVPRSKAELVEKARLEGVIPRDGPTTTGEQLIIEKLWHRWRKLAEFHERIFYDTPYSDKGIYAFEDAATCASKNMLARTDPREVDWLISSAISAYWHPSDHLLVSLFGFSDIMFEASTGEASILVYQVPSGRKYRFEVDESCLVERLAQSGYAD